MSPVWYQPSRMASIVAVELFQYASSIVDDLTITSPGLPGKQSLPSSSTSLHSISGTGCPTDARRAISFSFPYGLTPTRGNAQILPTSVQPYWMLNTGPINSIACFNTGTGIG